MVEEIKKIIDDNQDKRICVLGTTCTGKTTLLKEIQNCEDMDELIFPLLTPEEEAYVNQDPWTPQIGEYMNNLVRTKLHIEKGKPLFGTVLVDCDLIIYLFIEDDLLQERTNLRGANFENAKNMQTNIEKEIASSSIPCIKVKVKSNLQRNLDVLNKIISKINSPINYVLSGSTSLAFQGVNVIPKDIDIFTDKNGVDYFYGILKDYTLEPPKVKDTEEAISYYIKCFIDDVQVEIIGDFITKNNDGTFNESTIDYNDIIFKEYQGTPIPIMTLQKELLGYQQLNRLEKVKKIQDAIQLSKRK